MQIIINGKKCILPDNASVAEARRHQAGVGSDQLVQENSQGGKVLQDHEPLKEGAKLWSIPQIIKGSDDPRIAAEIALLREAAGRGSEVVQGTKTIGDRRYTAVLVKRVRVAEQKFGVTFSDMLFLLPPEYPKLPPCGCYLSYKWPTSDKHFILRTAYGAPLLVGEGWYWYCLHLGRGSAAHEQARAWRPGVQAADGHNLAKLFVAARFRINSDEE